MASSIPEELKAHVRVTAANRCGYCLTHQSYVPGNLEIEHIVPQSKGGSDEETNLWLACRACNLFRSNQTHGVDPVTGRRHRLFNPRNQRWRRHFRWSPDGRFIIGRTATGRATVVALNLNNMVAITVRRNWVLEEPLRRKRFAYSGLHFQIRFTHHVLFSPFPRFPFFPFLFFPTA